MEGANAKRRTAYTTRRRPQMDAPLHSSHFLDHRRGRRLSAGASPCRRIPRGASLLTYLLTVVVRKMEGTNAKERTAYPTRRRRQMNAPVHSSLFLDHRRGRRLSAGASPCRRIPRGGAVPSQACSICGASSTRVAAKAFCVATDIMLHHRFSHANAADLRRRGAAS